MNRQPASLYLDSRSDIVEQVEQAMLVGVEQLDSAQPVPIFFRADDIGVLSANFTAMMHLFSYYQTPLCLAVVPAWLTSSRWTAIGAQVDTGSKLWHWHQHGWSHTNHESKGKKSEFGPSRPARVVEADIRRGRDRLIQLIGKDLAPFFTPPWNRCSDESLKVVTKIGFSGISRSRGEQKQPAGLPDIFVNVDLHTRKETDGSIALEGLCCELDQAIKDRRIGVMIHHQRMNDKALQLLDRLLAFIADHPRFQAMGFPPIRDLNSC